MQRASLALLRYGCQPFYPALAVTVTEVAAAILTAAVADARAVAVVDVQAARERVTKRRLESANIFNCTWMGNGTSSCSDRFSGNCDVGTGMAAAVGGLGWSALPDPRMSRSSSLSSRQTTSKLDSRSTSADGCGGLIDACCCCCCSCCGCCEAFPSPPILALLVVADCATDLDADGALLLSSSSELQIAYTVRRRF